MQPKTMARVVTITVKPGMGPQFEAGMKKYHQWQHEHNITSTYYTWEIVSGKRFGEYITATFNHDWKDFDAMEKENMGGGAQIQADMGDYVESVDIGYWALRPDLSTSPANPGAAPAPFAEVETFFIKPGGDEAIEDVIKQVGAAIQRSHWQGKPADWYSLVNGGEGSQLVLASDRANWADFQPPETSFMKMLTGVYGKDGAQALLTKFDKALKSERSEILRYLPDLSYIPSSQ